MAVLYDMRAVKKPVNVTVNGELLAQAKDAHINLSAVLEHALAEEVNKRKAAAWKEEAQEAIAEYNKNIEEQGLFSEGIRTF